MKKYIIISLIVFVISYIIVISGYILNKNINAKKSSPGLLASSTESILITQAQAESSNLDNNLVLVNTVTINAKAAKNLEEANDRTKTYLDSVLLLSSGDIAHIIKNDSSQTLFLNSEKLGENVFIMTEMAKNLLYISNDFKNNKHSLFYGKNLLAKGDIASLTDIFDIKEIDGKISYAVTDGTLQQKILFYDGKKIAQAQDIKDAQKTSAGFSYVTRDYTKNRDTLYYNGRQSASAYEIPNYLEIGDKLAYTTFTFVDKAPAPNEGFLGGEYPTQETLFYDGKKIIVAGLIDIYNISNKLAYIRSEGNKKELFYDNKKIATADDITGIKAIENKISYITKNFTSNEQKLFLGDTLVVTMKNLDNINSMEIGGKLAYTIHDNLTKDSTTFYNSETIGTNVNFTSIIASNISGGLCYTIFDKAKMKNNLVCNKKIITEDVHSLKISNSSSSALFILKSQETASSTILSVYKFAL